MIASIILPYHCSIFALVPLGLKPDPMSGRLEVIGPEGGYLLLTY